MPGARGIAVSNIAWGEHEDDAAAELLVRLGASAVEVAPTRRWPSPPDATDAEAREYRALWESRALPIVSCQALLFGRPELRIFGDERVREQTLGYLTGVLRLAGRLGAGPCVFGSPKNRQVAGLPARDAERIAVEFFTAAGRAAEDAGVSLCLEPNPPAYGCDFLTNTAECVAFLERANAPGLGLHLDAGALTMNAEPIEEALAAARPWLRHFHISEPNLAPIGIGGAPHARIARALSEMGYAGWLSIEMRPDAGGGTAAHLRSAVETARRAYAPLLATS